MKNTRRNYFVCNQMSRTPLFNALRRALRLACLANHPSAPPVDELVEMNQETLWTRRRFLKTSAVAALSLGSGSLLTACGASIHKKSKDTAPRIVIVGAGIAGLNTAYNLKKAGLYAEIYEASKRTGGRIYTAQDIMAPGLSTELGGEFIDSGHKEMLALVEEFGLELIDVQASSEARFIREAYYFGGTHYTEAQVVEAFRPIAAHMQADYDKLEDRVDFENEGGATVLDRTSLAQYLENIGATGWFRDLLDVAFVTEYGLDSDQQSALNLLFLISTDVSEGKFEVFGESDERYKIKGGNQRVVDELAKRVEGQIKLGYRLEAIKTRGNGFTLTFEGPNGSAVEVNADFVVMCIPFSILRNIEMQVELPAVKKKAIAELGYGTNAKVMVGFHTRIWRDLGYSGNLFSDEPFQLAWDNSRLQSGDAGGLTLFSGGHSGIEVGTKTPAEQAMRLLAGVEKAFPGISTTRNGKFERFHWPSFPFSRGSYACYKPGQWTTIAGAEIQPVGHLFFAGEHCSYDFQGFMNGGAETGKIAAESLLAILSPQVRKRRYPKSTQWAYSNLGKEIFSKSP